MLRRFLGYLDKVFDFTARARMLRDGRVGGSIPTLGLWQSVFWMFVLRLPSFHALEQELRRPRRWEALTGRRKPSADALAYGLSRFCLDPLRALVRDHLRLAWRIKAIHGRPGQTMRVVAMDGHELFSSRARCCSECNVRRVKEKDQEVQEYYHRVVVAQWIGVTPPPILDIEPVRPGEGEVVAAGRLWERIVREYGRLIDVVSVDAIYLEAPFLKKVLETGKHFVVVMKQEARDLFQDAQQLRSSIAAQLLEEPGKTSRVWDLPELTTFHTLGRAVRVVWAEERTAGTEVVGNQRRLWTQDSTWVWVTDLSAAQASAGLIQRWGHDRWDVENRGFNELVHQWKMNHCFVHDARAIEAILLTLALAFVTTYLFYERNLKPELRRHLNRAALARRMAESLGEVALRWSG